MNREFRWATMCPRSGGGAIGCMRATGVKPLFHVSYSDYHDIDMSIESYWPDVPLYEIDRDEMPSEDQLRDIDFVMCITPCGAISTQNTSTGIHKGVDAPKLQNIYHSAEWVLENVKPRVLFGENAQAIFHERGSSVSDKLYDIAKKHGYSFSLYLTDARSHGLPQSRTRCFYFMWKSGSAPIMRWISRPFKGDLTDFFGLIPSDATMQDIYLWPGIASEVFPPYGWFLEKKGLTHQECVKKYDRKGLIHILEREGLLRECIEWMEEFHCDYKISKEDHAMSMLDMFKNYERKFDTGSGVFDRTPYFCTKYTKCVIRKNVRCMVHPVEDRWLNMREYLTLMGMPFDFTPVFPTRVDSLDNFQRISRGVPVNVAEDVCREVIRFLDGSCEMSEFDYVKQDNLKRRSKSV